MPQFSHLHVHTQFSLLDGAADITKMVNKAVKDDMKAMAITDHGNMFGVFKFVAECGKKNIKPIVGCEFYVVEDRHVKQFSKEKRDKRYHQLMLAKNPKGYQNLIKLCSLGYMEGLYSKWPRIDKELILKYHEGLIATTCCIGAIIPQTILREGEEAAEKELKWWLDLFGEDFYIELQRHDIPEQEIINATLLKLAKKYNVKTICTNDSHYVDQEDANAHDILLCVNTGDLQSTPIATDEEGGKGYRFGFPNDKFFFKTQKEMELLFHDVPEALDNTNEIVDKVETLKLKRDILLPNFPIPEEFKKHAGTPDADNLNQWEYLHHITYEGAKERYHEITEEIRERLDFELFTIKTMGFAGYFLIVSDFIKAGRDLGVLIGPGRGSAAGSAVAYCIGITNIDPIKYNLLFERFLNPDRKSMPDIDTDFDDEGRQKVIDYVVDKYGKNQVAQIITYGSMAAKSSIKDVARVLDLPLQESNMLAKLVPDRPGTELKKVLLPPLEEVKKELDGDDFENVKMLREILDRPETPQGKVLKEALILEGSVRNVGIHAAGIIIAPYDLTDIVPVSTAKDSDLLVTQYDGKVIEDAGVIKMDFLGLRTLTIIKDALKMIKENHGIEIDIDTIPLDDAKTFEIYQRGETNGTFQFESAGMQKHLKDLRPDKFEDLIAMNALYRPGPLEYIPSFIRRKHGEEPITYDLPEMQEYLEETYGITVYQEQVMLLSQKLANFSKGDADVLRKAMGKKQIDVLNKMEAQFVEGATKNGHPQKVLEKIWNDWKAFAQYAFNKSHSTCYAFVAYQTAYLKAHYPEEFMSAVLNHAGDIKKITFFMEECKRMNIPVLGPDINESNIGFAVGKSRAIRFGMGAIKGVGEKALESIIEERKKNGEFTSVFDMVKRINMRAANKKTLESLVLSGAFDCFSDIHRAQYFQTEKNTEVTFLEKIMKWGAAVQSQKDNTAASLFGDVEEIDIPVPEVPYCEPWNKTIELSREKDVVGFYISGHPLDQYKFEIDNFCRNRLLDFENLDALANKPVSFAGIVTEVQHRIGKSGAAFGIFKIEDFDSAYEFMLFKEDYLKFKHFFDIGQFLYFTGKVDKRFRNSESYEVKILTIQLLEDLRSKKLTNITLRIEINCLTDQLIDDLKAVVDRNPGEADLKFKVIDVESKFGVDLISKSIKINPSNEFLAVVKALEEKKIIKMDLN